MASNWLSNLASNVKSTFSNYGLGDFKSPIPETQRVKVRARAPSTPRANFSSNFQKSFNQNLTRFKTNQQKDKVNLGVDFVISSLNGINTIFQYDIDFKKHYQAHRLLGKLEWNF